MKIDKIWNQLLEDEERDFMDENTFSNLLSGITTGIASLDQALLGLQKSNLYVIGGLPGIGKSAFAISMMVRQSCYGNISVVYFSLESSNRTITERIMSNATGIDYARLTTRQITEEEGNKYKDNADRILNAPLFIESHAELSIEELERRAPEYVTDNNVQVIIIDYLQAISCDNSHYKSRNEELGYIMRKLKAISMKLDIPVVVLAQNSRCGRQRFGSEEKVPQLSDLWGTSGIEAEADTVIFIHRPAYHDIYEDEYHNSLRNQIQIHIAKSRNSILGHVCLEFNGNQSLIYESKEKKLGFIKKMSHFDEQELVELWENMKSIPTFLELQEHLELEVENSNS